MPQAVLNLLGRPPAYGWPLTLQRQRVSALGGPVHPGAVTERGAVELQGTHTTTAWERGCSTALLKLTALSYRLQDSWEEPKCYRMGHSGVFQPKFWKGKLQEISTNISNDKRGWDEAVWYLEVSVLWTWPCHTFSATSQGFCLLQECSSTHHRNSTCWGSSHPALALVWVQNHEEMAQLQSYTCIWVQEQIWKPELMLSQETFQSPSSRLYVKLWAESALSFQGLEKKKKKFTLLPPWRFAFKFQLQTSPDFKVPAHTLLCMQTTQVKDFPAVSHGAQPLLLPA